MQCDICPRQFTSMRELEAHKRWFHHTHDTSPQNCPDCDKPLVRQEGCMFCPSCGYSKC